MQCLHASPASISKPVSPHRRLSSAEFCVPGTTAQARHGERPFETLVGADPGRQALFTATSLKLTAMPWPMMGMRLQAKYGYGATGARGRAEGGQGILRVPA